MQLWLIISLSVIGLSFLIVFTRYVIASVVSFSDRIAENVQTVVTGAADAATSNEHVKRLQDELSSMQIRCNEIMAKFHAVEGERQRFEDRFNSHMNRQYAQKRFNNVTLSDDQGDEDETVDAQLLEAVQSIPQAQNFNQAPGGYQRQPRAKDRRG